MSELTNELRGEANGPRAMGDHGNAEMLDRTADRIDKLEECLREVVESHEAFLQMLVVNTAMAMRGEVELIDESAAIRNDAAIAKARAMLEE